MTLATHLVGSLFCTSVSSRTLCLEKSRGLFIFGILGGAFVPDTYHVIQMSLNFLASIGLIEKIVISHVWYNIFSSLFLWGILLFFSALCLIRWKWREGIAFLFIFSANGFFHCLLDLLSHDGRMMAKVGRHYFWPFNSVGQYLLSNISEILGYQYGEFHIFIPGDFIGWTVTFIFMWIYLSLNRRRALT